MGLVDGCSGAGSLSPQYYLPILIGNHCATGHMPRMPVAVEGALRVLGHFRLTSEPFEDLENLQGLFDTKRTPLCWGYAFK